MSSSLAEDIRRVVAEAIRQGSMLRVAETARALASAHPEEGLCANAVADMLMEAGIQARVPLEIDTVDPCRAR